MNRDLIYLQHILDAILKIESYVSAGKDAFMEDSIRQDAVIRKLEIIGEASKKISDDLRKKHPAIPWKDIAGSRDVLIHDYMDVDLDIVWENTQQDLPDLKKNIQQILIKEK